MARHYIGTTDQFPVGEATLVQVGGRKLGIYRFDDDQFHALLNYCPHQGAELCRGPVTSWLRSPKPGEFQYEKEGEIVRCPWHGWEFDIRSGCMVVDHKVRTLTYDVTVERFDVSVDEGKVYVKI
ncbi:Rieske (2Fe-2S) protein [Paenibacillus antri]|uniref:Rieske (2Fe-2S) protein n=1 Tax=Paenibacillus antri TaxID=2582848 RepID=A0A5R9GF56_9BACL|nr:Rieske (2Fe-2S) protein [Paenibacillus antri]TLS52770.1 Rieske (2Fe-2S) protein [Paenibacillus antri]